MSLRAAAAFLASRRRWRDRASLEAWQAKRLDAWWRDHAARVPAFAGGGRLADQPVITKADLLDRFEAFNRLGLTAARAMRMADGAAPPPGHFVGASTGTMGPRQPYLISDAERQVWLGTILAKTLGWAALRRPRVAVVLPRGSALYEAAGRALPLCFVPIGDGFDAVAAHLEPFAPDILIAPPRALCWLAEAGAAIAPRRLFSVAEVLDPGDDAAIRAGWPEARLDQIYMATEGLLATPCALGHLHLAEDRVHFELQPAPGGLVSPVITDFTRRAQIMARYRMGDLLRMGGPCRCGSVLARVDAVLGRADDVFDLGGVTITPDVLRDAVVAVPGIDDFRIRQVGAATVELLLPPGAPSAAGSLRSALARAGGQAQVVELRAALTPPVATKLRRVERVWRG